MIVSSRYFHFYMRLLARLVWTQQTEAFRFNLILQEETITEVLLLDMAKNLTALGFRVRVFNRTEEGGLRRSGHVVREGHGADWEWFYRTPNCMVGFRVQAKRLYRSLGQPGRHGGFNPNGIQIRNLISNAGQANPIYVFYNHPEVGDAHLFGRLFQSGYFGHDFWGCSVATATFMATVPDAKLSTIFPGQVPWHRFFGIGKVCRSESMMRNMPGGQEFRWSDRAPDWVDMLLEDRRLPDDRLDRYLDERGLRGVAYFDYG